MPESTIDFRLGNFYPRYYPDDVDVEKERTLEGEDALCEGEYIKDMGGKNRTVNIEGVVLGTNVDTLHQLADNGGKMELLSMQWSGEVFLEKCSIRGPKGWDGGENAWWFKYRIDAKSTGRDELADSNYGILDNGPAVDGIDSAFGPPGFPGGGY